MTACTIARPHLPHARTVACSCIDMLPELGQVALILALLAALLQAALPLVGAQRGDRRRWMALARPAAYAQLALVALAFAHPDLRASSTQDFSLRYVAENSNSLLPLIYRYTAVWGAHEGSLLLWALILALWTGAVAGFSKSLPDARDRARARRDRAGQQPASSPS